MILAVLIVAAVASVKCLTSRFRDKVVSESGELVDMTSLHVSKTKSGILSITQIVDHFDRSNQQTFAQRYFVNSTFW
jgi:inorganic pyrophosphatase/exopolyphosphatase